MKVHGRLFLSTKKLKKYNRSIGTHFGRNVPRDEMLIGRIFFVTFITHFQSTDGYAIAALQPKFHRHPAQARSFIAAVNAIRIGVTQKIHENALAATALELLCEKIGGGG